MGALVAVFFAPVVRRHATFSVVENMQEYSFPWFDVASPPTGALYPQLDQADFVHPRQVFLDRSLKVDHQIPLWDPMTFGGHPFFAGTGSRLAYPPLLLLSLIFSPSWTHDVYVALHLFAAGIAVFALMRELRVGTHGALLAAVAWAFGSYSMSWVTLEMYAAPMVLLPVALLCVRRWYDRTSLPALLTGALALGFLFLGTSVENALFCFLAVGAYIGCLTLIGTVRRWSGLSGRARLALLTAPALLVLAALAVAAVGVLPFLDLNGVSERAATANFTRAISVVPAASFGHLLVPPPVLVDIFKQTLVIIRSQVFAGTLVALLAALGVFLRRPGSGLGRGLAVGLFLFTVGTPLTWLALRVMPPLQALNGFGRALFLFDLGVVVLAGLGLDALVRAIRRRSDRETVGGRRRAWLALPGVVAAVCLVVTAAQLIPYGRRVNAPFQPRTEAKLYPPTPAIEAAKALIGPSPGRSPIVPIRHPGSFAMLVGTAAMAVDLPTVSGYEPVVPASVSRLWRVVGGEPIDSVLSNPLPGTLLLLFDSLGLRTDLLARAGIAAVMAPPDVNGDTGWGLDNLASRGLRQVYAGPDATVLEVLDRRPRAAVVPRATWASSPAEALTRFVDPTFDSRSQVVLEGRPRATTAAAAGAPTAATEAQGVEWRIDSPNHLRLRVGTDAPGWLVLQDGWDAGWRATVNGRDVEVLRANSNFRAVAVPAGASTVDFVYRPTSIVLGAAVSLMATAIILGVMVVAAVRRRRAGARRGVSTP